MKTSYNFYHKPVLLKESIEYLNLKNKKNGIWVDATLGLGGHTKEILKNLDSSSLVIAIDCDEESIEIAKKNLKEFKNIIFEKENFKNIDEIFYKYKIEKIDGIIYDLGVSSLHFEKADRGFSFNKKAKLDMRLDKQQKLTAYDVVNFYSENEIAEIIKNFGEDEDYKKIAKEIVKSRPIETTIDLANIINRIKTKKEKIDKATKVFQAIRIAVNNELENIEISLKKVIGFLKKEGRIVVISFHSLEDRIVKDFFIKESKDCICENKKLPCRCGHVKTLKIITKKPVVPTKQEIMENKRARSAKLRAAEKI